MRLICDDETSMNTVQRTPNISATDMCRIRVQRIGVISVYLRLFVIYCRKHDLYFTLSGDIPSYHARFDNSLFAVRISTANHRIDQLQQRRLH